MLNLRIDRLYQKIKTDTTNKQTEYKKPRELRKLKNMMNFIKSCFILKNKKRKFKKKAREEKMKGK